MKTGSEEIKLIVGGKMVFDSIGEIKIMAIADGWVMARRPQAMPFVIEENFLKKKILEIINNPK